MKISSFRNIVSVMLLAGRNANAASDTGTLYYEALLVAIMGYLTIPP